MEKYICTQCGVQHKPSDSVPERCIICEDDRQYVNWGGQQWTTLEQLRKTHRNKVELDGDELYGIGIDPSFAIGQRALLVSTPEGNILWDCISLIDDDTKNRINELGGIKAIAISHPHFYSSMVEWSEAFGDVPVYLHQANRKWVMHDDPNIHYWKGDTFSPWDGLTLIRCGGHFKGSTVLRWAAGAHGKGALLTGDTIQVVMDRRYVSFMYSYPNLIPLSVRKVKKIVKSVKHYPFERIYGGWWNKNVTSDAQKVLKFSSERYIRTIEEN